MSLRPYIHELLRYHHSLDNSFSFFSTFDLLFFVSYLYFYVAAWVNPKFESPKKKKYQLSGSEAGPLDLTYLWNCSTFSRRRTRGGSRRRREKKTKAFRLGSQIFYDIPRYPKPDPCQWVFPPLALYFFLINDLSPSKICFFVGNDGAPRSWPPSESVTIIILTEAISYTGCRF